MTEATSRPKHPVTAADVEKAIESLPVGLAEDIRMMASYANAAGPYLRHISERWPALQMRIQGHLEETGQLKDDLCVAVDEALGLELADQIEYASSMGVTWVGADDFVEGDRRDFLASTLHDVERRPGECPVSEALIALLDVVRVEFDAEDLQALRVIAEQMDGLARRHQGIIADQYEHERERYEDAIRSVRLELAGVSAQASEISALVNEGDLTLKNRT